MLKMPPNYLIEFISHWPEFSHMAPVDKGGRGHLKKPDVLERKDCLLLNELEPHSPQRAAHVDP